MARVAIVSYDVQTIFGKAGGVGSFTTRWANLLREAGEDVTIVMTRADWEPMRVDTHWRARYQANGISLIELQAPPPVATRWPEVPAMRVSEIAAPILNGFDIVYFQDWGHAGFHLMRERRFHSGRGPVCVTVLHGPSEWELSSNERYPKLPDDLHLSYLERYSALHSDFVVSPSCFMVEHLSSLGWKFREPVEALGLPMPEPDEDQAPQGPPQIRRIVYFGRVEERKGIRNFVLALQRLTKMQAKPEVIILGSSSSATLLEFALQGIRGAGFAVTHEYSFDSEQARDYLRQQANETLCVIPSPCDNHPYSVVEASLIEGLNLIVCRGGGVPEILPEAERQMCDPQPRELAAKIAECLAAPLMTSELKRYDCRRANEQWMTFHRRALAMETVCKPASTGRKLRVDVCVTYYQKPQYLGQLMDALEQQTEMDFHVIGVNDGSPDEESNRVFDEQSVRAAAHGWDFYRQANAFVDAARNGAARRGDGDLLLFVDADDLPARHAVARMREAMALSGEDALLCGSYLFASEDRPFDPATGEVLVSPYATCIPLGMDLVGGLVNPCAFGGSMFMIRRSTFEAVGGYRELRGAGHEDWELYVRLALAGYKVDVLPELLQFYRQVEGSLARTLPREAAKRRLIDAYEDGLSEAGLQGAALALAGLYQSAEEMEKRIRKLEMKTNAAPGKYAFFSGATQSFEIEPTGPGRLQQWYRGAVSLQMRLKIHEVLLSPFLGPYKPPPA